MKPVRPYRAPLVLAALTFFAEGAGTQAMGLALPGILRAWSVPRQALSVAIALGLVGFAAGAVVGGLAADRLGRRTALLLSLLCLGLCTLTCALAHDPLQLGIVRTFAGFALGASLPVAATVMAESAPATVRSLAMAVGLAFLPLGGFAAGLAASIILPLWGWRAVFVATGAVGLAAAVIGVLLLRPEGRPTSLATGSAALAPRGRLRDIQDLLRAGRRRDTLGLWGAFFCVVLLYYSMFSWAPTAFASVGLTLAQASRALSAFALGGLMGGLIAGGLVQRWGSRSTLWLLCIGALASASVLPRLAVTAPANAGLLQLAVATLGATVTGVQTLLFALGPQIYERAERGSGLGLAVGVGRIGAVVSSFTAVAALDVGGVTGFFGSLALAIVLALVSGLIVRSHVPGTAGTQVAAQRERI